MMRQLLLLICLLAGIQLSAQEAKDPQKEKYRKIFVSNCVSEAKKNSDINAKAFCDCSFEKFYQRVLESGVDVLVDPNFADKIQEDKDFQSEVLRCLTESSPNGDNELFRREFMKGCLGGMKKDKNYKTIKKYIDPTDLCECSYAKIMDGPYSVFDLSKLSAEEAEAYYAKIGEECFKIYLENKGFILE